MVKKFEPNISPKAFEKAILDIMDREGGDWQAIRFVRNEILKYQEANYYQSFLKACRDNDVLVKPVAVNMGEQQNLRVEVWKDGRCWHFADLTNEHENVSAPLASILFRALAIKLGNKEFINKASEG